MCSKMRQNLGSSQTNSLVAGTRTRHFERWPRGEMGESRVRETWPYDKKQGTCRQSSRYLKAHVELGILQLRSYHDNSKISSILIIAGKSEVRSTEVPGNPSTQVVIILYCKLCGSSVDCTKIDSA